MKLLQVWNEMWMMSYPNSYLPLYNASALALKDVHHSLLVGGPSSQQTQVRKQHERGWCSADELVLSHLPK
eukprot:SAG31_NODE_2431_length_5707_cov_2.157810_4_plen_71_part_00